jgi:protein-tyrosine phosphatase
MDSPLPPALLSCAPNFRDIGGYETADGRRVKRGRVYRSQVVANPTPEDTAALNALGIRYVCDLRGSHEAARAPCAWPTDPAVEIRGLDIGTDVRAGTQALIDIMVADPTANGIRTMMMTTYGMLPARFAGRLSLFFDDLLHGGRFAAVIHCTAGKDRTGFSTAMLLLALGVPMETARYDYLLTEHYLDLSPMMLASGAYLHSVVGDRVEPDETMLRALCGVDVAYLDAAFGVVDRDYGSVDAYLEQAAGLDSAKRARLVDLLVA